MSIQFTQFAFIRLDGLKTFLATMSIILIVTLSCRQQDKGNEHPDFIEPVLDSAQRLMAEQNGRQAFYFLDSVYSNLPFNPGPYDRFRRYYFKAFNLFNNFRDFDSALLYADSMLASLEEKKDEHAGDYLSAHLLIASICLDQGRFAEAYTYYYKSKLLAVDLNAQRHYAIVLANLGLVSYRQEKYRQALSFFKDAFIQSAYCDTTTFDVAVRLRQEQLSNTGLCYEKIGIYDSAIYYYNAALDFISSRASGFPNDTYTMDRQRGVIYGNIGSTYSKQGNYAKAIEFLNRSVQFNEMDGFTKYDVLLNKIKLADVYMAMGKMDSIPAAISNIRSSLDTLPYETADLRWRKLAWQYYDKSGNLPKAYQAHLDYIALKDALNNKSRELPGLSFQTVFENYDKKHQIDSLVREKKYTLILMTLAIFLLLMAIVIIILIRKNQLQSRQSVAKLTKLNHRISTQYLYQQEMLESLEQSQESNKRLIHVIAHDLRNPVAAMVSISDLLLFPQLDEMKRREMIDMIKTSGLDAIQFMEDLLRDNSKIELQTDTIALHDLVDYSVQLMRFRAAEKNITFSITLQPAEIRGDRQKIWRAVNNIIVNAIKFTPENKSIQVNLSNNGDRALLLIKDQGIGIPDDIKDRIFDDYSGPGRTGTSGEVSFGMGLHISRQTIKLHKGKVWFETEVGVGTTFFIELPTTSSSPSADM